MWLMANECIFCQIVAGQIPSKLIYQDEEMVAFPDINPLAPKHILIVPRLHFASLAELPPGREALVSHLLLVARELARKEGIDRSGYRLVLNSGRDGDQTIPHIHLHLLGGRHLSSQLG